MASDKTSSESPNHLSTGQMQLNAVTTLLPFSLLDSIQSEQSYELMTIS